MDWKGGWDVRFVSLSLRHNLDRNDTWCRQRCCAGGRTRRCHVLMVKTMVKVDPALLELHFFAIRFTYSFRRKQAIA